MQTSQTYRYQLDGSNREPKRKINCPYCEGKRCFTRYKDYETGNYIDDSVGMCDRGNKCQAHVKPKEWFAMHPEQKESITERMQTACMEPVPIVNIPVDILRSTLKTYEENSFIKALLPLFPAQKIEKAITDYYIGTANNVVPGSSEKAVVFWFVNQNNEVRAGQVKQFDANCKTIAVEVAEKQVKAFWIHRQLKKNYLSKRKELPQWLQDYEAAEKVNCLFGEHLLNKYPGKPVALVEAPKSAIIGSMVYPEMSWLATSSLTYLTKERCKVLAGRRVMLIPDCGIPNPKTGKTCLDQWKERVKEFEDIAFFAFSTLFEDAATDEQKKTGFDIADAILDEIRKPQIVKIQTGDIEAMPIITKTGPEFGNLILSTVWMKDKRRFDILYDKNGELITESQYLQQLSEHFNKSFLPGILEGNECLINKVD